MPRITRENLNNAIKEVGEAIEFSDPAGVNFGLRTYISYGLYKKFDDLRACQDAFDREELLRALQLAIDILTSHPVIQEGKLPPDASESVEVFTADLYSRCWTYYTDDQFLEMAKLFSARFEKNNITIDLTGKKCIDLGCGSGRYVVAMADQGADESHGLDLSNLAIRDAIARCRRLGYADKCQFQQGSLLGLPFEDEYFDFVSCNGVLHHTTDPKLGLKELARITKRDGLAYIMVYGSGELWWDLTDMIRKVLEVVPRGFAFANLDLMTVPSGKIFNFMDHMFVPCREVISHAEFQDRLRDVGFRSWQIMERGEAVDSAERRFLNPEDVDLVGEADLRYVCRFS